MIDCVISRHLVIDHDALEAFCRRHHIKRLSLFGSALRDNFHPDSDVDVLVEFLPGHVPGFEFVTIERELSSLLQGRRVDLGDPHHDSGTACRPWPLLYNNLDIASQQHQEPHQPVEREPG